MDDSNQPAKQANQKHTKSKSAGTRQWILVGLLFLMIGAFLYDKYVLLPSAEEKINKIMNDVSLKISDNNRSQVDEIIGFAPATTYEHKGLEVAQYRFPRAIPFILKRPPLDIAFKGDAIAILRQVPITKEAIDAEFGEIEIDRSKNKKGTINAYESPTGM